MLSYIVPFIILILVVVFIHEYGHYYFAKKYGVGITDFSIGFGQEIFGWNDKSGTRWKICWIPLGGYVKFFGDRNVFSQSDQEELIKKYVINSNIIFERKIALVFQAIEDIGYHSSFDALIAHIINEYDKNSDSLSIEDKYRLLGILYQTGDIEGTIKLGKNLLLFHYDSDLNNIDMQKYIGEILLDVMGTELFTAFCQDTFINNKIEISNLFILLINNLNL